MQDRQTSPRQPRGVTLIELMVVVAIVAILAGIGGTAYMKQLRKGKIAELKQFAMEVQKGQKQYSSRSGRYLTPDNNPYKGGSDKWEQLLEFQHDDLPARNIDVFTEGGTSSNSCSICPSDWSPDTSENWYVVVVKQDMNPSNSEKTTIYIDNKREKPMVINEGM